MGGRSVSQHDTDLLVVVVRLARMVKLLLTVRRLANTWGMDGQRRKERRRREETGGRASSLHQLATSSSHLRQLNMSDQVHKHT